MGRILIQMTLSANEKPKKMIMPMNTYREPAVDKYKLVFDIYEVSGGTDFGH